MSKKNKEQPKKLYLGRPGNNVSIGIVGMPNIGKSSLFNLLSKLNVPAMNYPFCTIDPNHANIPVPDDRLDKLIEIYKPKNVIQAVLTVYDIAGLVKGASEGKGLGNAFLSNIQAVDAIFHVCRAFKDKSVDHVEQTVDPVRDLEIISNELVQKDLAIVTRHHDEVQRMVSLGRDKTKERLLELETLKKAKECLTSGKDIREYEWQNEDVVVLNRLQLLTAKPVVYLINITKKDYLRKSNSFLPGVMDWVKTRSPDAPMIPFSVTYENELLDMDDEARAKAEEEAKSAIPRITVAGYHALRLIHYFTCGKQEVRAWTIKDGTLAPAAAGVIHSDFQKRFIMADVMTFEDIVKYGTEAEVKKNGRLMQRGKDYTVLDGDIMHFKSN